ncbi:Translation elongation factor LepA [Pediococcus damnosus]|uniref:Elongation factor 4 n=1 Tax=Pediococcus damnosus TaxID=51663 RepID=A0A0R2HLZ7_9LACO|nr:translation elongation factor 4 [Pediococcus damnosus]AMV63626.1 Translation elongation factor LepA [Pediococcus damnosus]AMV66433.1 Translation elongation factor LepA [Pediococcus damnosus]KRN53983.1 GTP-binding translation elongation factor LepA [Pediococcus damnosus]PJE49951.1 elongation factor 4 [Pediococcus damnosus]GEA92408.1 elongation factor 4 2 [Pediococcus damnosus]
MKQANIRNFSIIAHIDHGKSTLADRIMEQTHTVSERDTKAQLLDDMEVEQAHGITVKSRTVRNHYEADDGQTYEYNFIDTPGHVDFSYEVSKSLAASDGAVLLVDATQGVQAQTVANLRLAKQNHLVIIPVINKVDSDAADVPRTEAQIQKLDSSFENLDMLKISAKTGMGVHEVLEAIRTTIPAPTGDKHAPLKALVFDYMYDAFKGIIAYVRLIDGSIKADDDLLLMAKQTKVSANSLGYFAPNMTPIDELNAGDVGYVVTGLKDPQLVRVGDTMTSVTNTTKQPLAGYEPAKSMVFAGFYPKDNNYNELKLAIEKLSLNDSSFHYTLENSEALGAGFRCGFLGMLHLQIIRERLQDEYGLEVLTTAPNVTYHVYLNGKTEPMIVNNPINFPEFSKISYVEEPFVKAEITTPNDLLSEVMKLAEKHKSTLLDMDNQADLIVLTYKMPTSEVAYEFFNQLKSVSHGYATLDTTALDYEVADLVKVEVDINYATVDALSFVVHRQDADKLTQELVKKLKVAVPRRLYPTPVQAVVEGKAVARVDIPPLRKGATSGGKKGAAKKQALLHRQGVNKRKSAKNTSDLPQEVFNAVLELDL